MNRAGLGTKPSTLLRLMRRWRPSACLAAGASFGEVLGLLHRGKPVIALVHLGGWRFHYIALRGYDLARRVVYFTDTDGECSCLSIPDFLQLWDWDTGSVGDVLLDAAGVPTRTILF